MTSMMALLAVLLAVVAAAAPALAASLDPALCPFELGYNPVFNSDGSVLSCQKGNETFSVDAPNGTRARSLRGIGTSVLAIVVAGNEGDLDTFASFVDPGATFFLLDGAPRKLGDPVVTDFLVGHNLFIYAEGVDLTATYDVSRYMFYGGAPTSAFVHVRLTTATAFFDFDSVWRFNDVSGGKKLWQLFQAFNVAVKPHN
eukprot:TRINITY_DN9074_c0_g1_i1.p1 TRINITY_DN9074_c0_g1~~TRINITY_DN9074_c0_g1_i1.p1  ORF type:complete len:200 (-),score=51.10 TRINITY_DN9074_c0_g1_i1:544-1143(-)